MSARQLFKTNAIFNTTTTMDKTETALSADKFLISKGWDFKKQFANDPIAQNIDLWFEEYAQLRINEIAASKPEEGEVTGEIQKEIERLKAICKSDHDDGEFDRGSWRNQGMYQALEKWLPKISAALSAETSRRKEAERKMGEFAEWTQREGWKMILPEQRVWVKGDYYAEDYTTAELLGRWEEANR